MPRAAQRRALRVLDLLRAHYPDGGRVLVASHGNLISLILQAFEPGVRYPEHRVSQFLGAIYADYAALRRYLVDEELLSRAGGEYWRSGGSVPPSGVG